MSANNAVSVLDFVTFTVKQQEGDLPARFVKNDGRWLPVVEACGAVQSAKERIVGAGDLKKAGKMTLGKLPTEQQAKDGKRQKVKVAGESRECDEHPLLRMQAVLDTVAELKERSGWNFTIHPDSTDVRWLDGFVSGLAGWRAADATK